MQDWYFDNSLRKFITYINAVGVLLKETDGSRYEPMSRG